MRYTKEFSEGFTPWSGAVSAYERIVEEKGLDALENALEQIFEGSDEPPSDTEINDLLWFDADTVYNVLGMRPDSAETRTLDEIREAWKENNTVGYEVQKVEIIDYETVRVTFFDPEEETPPDEYETEDLNPEEVAALFGDDEGEIDEDAQTVCTWSRD